MTDREERMRAQLEELEADRDRWRKMYEEALIVARSDRGGGRSDDERSIYERELHSVRSMYFAIPDPVIVSKEPDRFSLLEIGDEEDE